MAIHGVSKKMSRGKVWDDAVLPSAISSFEMTATFIVYLLALQFAAAIAKRSFGDFLGCFFFSAASSVFMNLLYSLGDFLGGDFFFGDFFGGDFFFGDFLTHVCTDCTLYVSPSCQASRC